MELLPVNETLEENRQFTDNPACRDTLEMCIDFYKKIGFNKPWICYYAAEGGQLVGNAAFKGKPVDGKVEIAYGTMEPFRKKGSGPLFAKHLLTLLCKPTPPSK